MYEVFFESFNKKVPLTSEEQEMIKGYLTPKKLRKRQFLLQEGDVCKVVAFVEKGMLRAYSIEESGTEHIIQFAPEGWLISDKYSFLTREPSMYNVDAIEDSEVLLIAKEVHEEMLEKIPKYEKYIRLQITNAYVATQRRITSAKSLTLEERYQEFIDKYPAIVQKVPQHMIASYLGLTPESLSRLKKKMTVSKEDRPGH